MPPSSRATEPISGGPPEAATGLEKPAPSCAGIACGRLAPAPPARAAPAFRGPGPCRGFGKIPSCRVPGRKIEARPAVRNPPSSKSAPPCLRPARNAVTRLIHQSFAMWTASGAAARNAERTSSRRGKTELASALVRINSRFQVLTRFTIHTAKPPLEESWPLRTTGRVSPGRTPPRR